MIEYTVKVDDDGSNHWYLNDRLHREDGPAVKHTDGYEAWYLNGKRHREDGPAVERTDGYKVWYRNGELHREDGPAVERNNGDRYWYLNDQKLTEAEFNERMNPIEMTVAELADKLNIKNLKIVK